MFGELNQFDETINAAIAQGDSSFLAQALALSAAAGGTATAISGGTSTSTATTVEAGGQNPGVSTTATTRAAPGFTDPATTFAPFGDKDKRDISLEPGSLPRPNVAVLASPARASSHQRRGRHQ